MDITNITAPNCAFAFRRVRIRTLFIINGRLDETRLKSALTTLIRDHWRLLGARIIGDLKKFQLFYHVPYESFPKDYDLFKWSSEDVDSSINKAIPELNATPSKTAVLPIDVRKLSAKFEPRDGAWPFHLGDAQSDPLLLVHLTLFTDATVMMLSIPHIVCDALGLGSILRAWLGLMQGETPAPMVGVGVDLLPGRKPFGEYAQEEVRGKRRTRVKGKLDGVLVPLGFVPQLVRNPKEVRSVLLFPTGVVEGLRERVVQGFREKGEEDPGLTNLDVITAILTKLSRLDARKKHMLSLSQTVNLRGRIPELSDPDAVKGFIQNGLLYSTSRFRFHHGIPLGEIARGNRESIRRTLEPDTIDLYMAIQRELTRKCQGQHICEPLEKSYHVTNWSSAWRGLDFTPALESAAKEERGGKVPKVVVLGEALELGLPCRFSSVVMCKTEEGYWINFSVAEPTLRAVKKYLAEDPELKNMRI
ncbi:hypothetical protein B0T14DRAFT_600591 [Immersiella caudata]|uniref:Uncharacterized protein n=1 Tax=Immersiella caudata TaxID=314043 RepID=A0AA39X5L2_9PEZI|nr:hypothetical protein B0T14DRAFT_600591 [Immersiella caudata]